MRADRLLSVLLLLQVHRRITARELAERLEVSERTIHRDMEALGIAGVPVLAERGAGGGWALLENYQTKITGLNKEEIQALFFSRPEQLLTDLGMHRASEAAFIKLFASLPATSRRSAEGARQRFYVDSGGWRHSPEDISSLPVLQEAVWLDRKLRFTYQRDDECAGERVVDPLGLVAKGSVWYLAASSEDKIRTYRVSRIREAVVLDELSTRPAGFDLAECWHRSSSEFKANLPRYYASMRAGPDVLRGLRYGVRFGAVESTESADETGWAVLRIRFDAQFAACQFALSWGSQIEVVDPPELREQVMRAARDIVNFYERKESVC
jgi:predicted DNA-binding transcriptional regulator YafY